ncbi:MAG: Phosphoenolpyruvate carboxykinase [GTP] [Chlamydiales bacterium]|nr:Phosphoenolpyruvate carboxykinase [GTP] [Chlamydiales bacterium]MCH9635047.1 Phosphoenolpyruvate carboxykinase [GTP] [Chlamydiales bacterium]MCH9703287.1 phosphoenolpyruvate carboxykinase (GTP) [Chlamydiota bacterium]
MTIKEWVDEVARLTEPDQIHYCDGSETEFHAMAELLVQSGTFTKLNKKLRPDSYLACSDPRDVARVEGRTFICSEKEEDAGPTNNWEEPQKMRSKLQGLFKGSMRGRTLYVIPFSMGPLGSNISHIGVELTDSPYVVCNMHIMTRVGKEVMEQIEQGASFVRCLHSVGVPLTEGKKDVPWPCNPDDTHVVHFPSDHSIWSFGSGYGGNALLGKKCFALRIASIMGKEQGWLAEHMLIVGITNPEGKKRYFAAAFPSACGKTNLAMMEPKLPGWKVECVGDDIAWMKVGKDGRLWAINPEAGFFGVAPGTSKDSNPHALETCRSHSIFTNVALTKEGDVWWEGMGEPPKKATSWLGEEWTPNSDKKAAHPNSRFTTPAAQCPVMDPAWEDPKGVPISAIIFGGRRGKTVPLVVESFDWAHGTFMGAAVSSEMTAAAAGTVGKLRHDPFAMLPFCGYNMADYFGHWLEMERENFPKIYSVNWFRKKDGEFLWPGFGENIRILKWIFERLEGSDAAEKTAIGNVPASGALDLSNLTVDEEALFAIHPEEWLDEAAQMRDYLSQFGDRLPKGIEKQLESLEMRLHGAKI